MANKAHFNAVENLVAFAALVLAAHLCNALGADARFRSRLLCAGGHRLADSDALTSVRGGGSTRNYNTGRDMRVSEQSATPPCALPTLTYQAMGAIDRKEKT